MTIRAIVVIALVLATQSAGRAVAAQPSRGTQLKLMASDVQSFTSDGQRYVAYAQKQRIVVVDTRTSHRYVTPAPASCHMAPGPIGSLAFPDLLMDCGADDQGVLKNVKTGAVIELPATATWQSLGRDWVEGGSLATCPDGTGLCQPFYEWHTRETRELPVSHLQHPGPPFQFIDPDLNTATLPVATPCAPYETQSLVSAAATYEAPYVLLGAASTSFGYGLRLGHCGSRQTTTLTSAAGSSAQLSAGSVTWVVRGSVYDYDVAKKHTYRWTSPTPALFDTPLAATHTRYDVVIARTTKQACNKICTPSAVNLYRAAIPG